MSVGDSSDPRPASITRSQSNPAQTSTLHRRPPAASEQIDESDFSEEEREVRQQHETMRLSSALVAIRNAANNARRMAFDAGRTQQHRRQDRHQEVQRSSGPSAQQSQARARTVYVPSLIPPSGMGPGRGSSLDTQFSGTTRDATTSLMLDGPLRDMEAGNRIADEHNDMSIPLDMWYQWYLASRNAITAAGESLEGVAGGNAGAGQETRRSRVTSRQLPELDSDSSGNL